ncbi:MAG TPA: FliA/WhiG family RNA polymerase sigma factor, partial [Minicystis sp.]|nr:FliA/WhiG family RNA polymerase sigma factor [Minicystis sp.]
RIAMRLARRLPAHVGVADLVSSGWVGLIEAFSRAHDGMPLEEFEAYASHRVKGAMLDYLRSLDPSAREARNASRRVARAIARLSREHGRAPTEAEIADAIGVKLDEYHKTLTDIARAGMARLEIVDLDHVDPASGAPPPDEDADRRLLAQQVAEAIDELPPRLQQILSLYYREDCTLREIGEVLGVTESRVSQLHTEAMHRLRAAIGRA